MVLIGTCRSFLCDCGQIKWTDSAYNFASFFYKSREKLVELKLKIYQVWSLFSSHHETVWAIRKFRSKKFAPELQVVITAIIWQVHHVFFYFCLIEICNLLCDFLHGYNMLICFIDFINWLLLIFTYLLKHSVLMDHISYLPLLHFEALKWIKAVQFVFLITVFLSIKSTEIFDDLFNSFLHLLWFFRLIECLHEFRVHLFFLGSLVDPFDGFKH